MHMSADTQGCQRHWIPLELELQMVVNWKSNSGPVEEQYLYVFLTTEPSRQFLL